MSGRTDVADVVGVRRCFFLLRGACSLFTSSTHSLRQSSLSRLARLRWAKKRSDRRRRGISHLVWRIVCPLVLNRIKRLHRSGYVFIALTHD